MSRRPCTFRQADVTRALRAAKAAGYTVDKMKIDQAGNIVIVMRMGNADYSIGVSYDNEWDTEPADEQRQ